MTDGLLDWLRDRRRRLPASPAMAIYHLGAAIFAISMGLLGWLFDRYVLAFLPFVILFVVSNSARWGRISWAYSITALALIASFTLLAKADQVEHDNARW